ncbi:hypothetical protein LGR54_20760 [Ancylobacter sp. Lp-2]|uniref:hypothetical protein n=1 Tax=Ancylobacter sp. Lp-2 TaxID=2881339 RepID=UPI001E633ED3|nr:hypothetical protein [Ancylobacter sp. Lp-2]MCB4771045.1 hypothetical protein [Ancylobacter sp. Lp-2]
MSSTEIDKVAHKGRRPPAKKPRISRKMHQALEAYITGTAKTQVEAAAKAGISSEHFCRALKTDHIQAFVVRRTGELLGGLLPKAYRALDMVLEGENKAAALQGALVLFKQYGLITPDSPEVSVTVNQPGYVIDLSGSDGRTARIIDGTAIELPADGADGDDGDPQ